MKTIRETKTINVPKICGLFIIVAKNAEKADIAKTNKSIDKISSPKFVNSGVKLNEITEIMPQSNAPKKVE